MTNDEIRIKIAEACGWTHVEKEEGGAIYGYPKTKPMFDSCRLFKIPDYLNDLNAMHEAEKALTDEQDLEYSESLEQVVGARFNSKNGEDMRRLRSATAAQRAEAFLRTLNLWEE